MTTLFIPGPTDVPLDVREAQAKAMIGHRSRAFQKLFDEIQNKLRVVLQTDHRVYVTASSGSGLQEAAIRNCVSQKVLMCVCGAFGDRWTKVAQSNGVQVDRLDVEWGQANTPDQVEKALRNQSYDALTIVHNETSTGVENPVREIAAAAHAIKPDVLVLVDAVSSAGGVDIRPDEWGLDVLLTSSQKCFALPPGLAFAAVSDRVLERAQLIPHRGWYFDFMLLEKYMVERHSTPATPAVSLLYALDLQLDHILAEGLPARFQRHAQLAQHTRAWAAERFDLFAAKDCRSKTVSTVCNTRDLDIPELNSFLADYDMEISNGYGPLKGKTFRIAHMGETTMPDLEALFAAIDKFMAGK